MDHRKLFDYDYWANSETLASIRTVPGGSEKARKAICHIIGAQRIWMSRFENPAPPTAQPWPDLTLEECSAAIDDLHLRWHAILEGLTPEKLASDLIYLSLKGTREQDADSGCADAPRSALGISPRAGGRSRTRGGRQACANGLCRLPEGR